VNKKIAFIPATGKKARAQALGSNLFAIGEQGVAALETAHRNGLGELLRPLRSQLEVAD
jgi:isopentenyl diphosphate isomerase/L-lactate dehydrogenase-like FMN-dependent dehydrogenase